ncbi:MAG: hypothetical protein OEZ01_18300, partial [Candidatus Heimdallarchaeota archaeon]|nr:hypothetical protein [Candidatus Heimdallarchaeota archaeon]
MDENSVIKLLKYLSGLSSIDTTLSQNDTFIHLILQELSSIFHADYAYIGFYIQQSGSSRKLFSKSYGLPEEQCIYLNSLVTKKRIKTTSTKLQTHASVYQLGNVVSVDMGNQQKTETIGIKTIIQLPIFSNSNQNGSIALYYSKPSKLESQNLDYLYIIGEMISNLFLLKSNL